jgi:hypothetical protein
MSRHLRLRRRVVRCDCRRVRASLGVAYIVAAVVAAVLPFLAFGLTGLFVLVPTALWLAPGLRTDAPRTGNLTDGVVGWPGLTALVCAASGFAVAALRGRMMAAAWLGSCAACGLLEMARARLAKTDDARAEFRSRRP